MVKGSAWLHGWFCLRNMMDGQRQAKHRWHSWGLTKLWHVRNGWTLEKLMLGYRGHLCTYTCVLFHPRKSRLQTKLPVCCSQSCLETACLHSHSLFFLFFFLSPLQCSFDSGSNTKDCFFMLKANHNMLSIGNSSGIVVHNPGAGWPSKLLSGNRLCSLACSEGLSVSELCFTHTHIYIYIYIEYK